MLRKKEIYTALENKFSDRTPLERKLLVEQAIKATQDNEDLLKRLVYMENKHLPSLIKFLGLIRMAEEKKAYLELAEQHKLDGLNDVYANAFTFSMHVHGHDWSERYLEIMTEGDPHLREKLLRTMVRGFYSSWWPYSEVAKLIKKKERELSLWMLAESFPTFLRPPDLKRYWKVRKTMLELLKPREKAHVDDPAPPSYRERIASLIAAKEAGAIDTSYLQKLLAEGWRKGQYKERHAEELLRGIGPF
ncbi:MAG: hypothetical protein GXN92_00755 [Candidatus Micrarchaeota archaeon]|nr:hypothetical protein [Candidatus Micrarchaeota archaeon]